MERVTFLKPFVAPEVPEIWGAKGAPIFSFFFNRRRRGRLLTPRPGRRGRPWRPNFFFFFHRRRRPRFPRWAPEAPNGGTGGATPQEGEGNPAEGVYFLSLYTNTLLDGSVTPSVTLSIRYRNHFPVVQFQSL